MDSIQRNYFWKKDKTQGLYPKAWSGICSSKRNGGLSLKDTKTFNLALLAKLAWRMLSEKNAKWNNLIRARYFRNEDPLCDTLQKSGTWIWQSIKKGLEVIKKFYIWEVGDGTSINVFKHNWIPNTEPKSILSPQSSNININMKVQDLIN